MVKMEFDPSILFNDSEEETYIEPDRIFASLFSKDEKYDFLRDVQTEILNKWFAERDKRKDTIVKMNTGAGKTFVGLIILQSSINEGYGPAIYICPDKQLVDQVLSKSKEYGIECVTFEKYNEFPQKFLNSEAILVTVFDKMFNGQSLFEKNNIEVGTILLDDAHSCISKARDKFTLSIKRDSPIFEQLYSLFQTELHNQDVGGSADIYNGNFETIMQVPFWTWSNSIGQVANILSVNYSAIQRKMHGRQETTDVEKNIYFTYPLISNYLEACFCFISGDTIEITPHCLPVKQLSSFYYAKRRFFMSATLLDDSLLIKELDISKDAILNPLINNVHYNIGERMILIPSLLEESLNMTIIPKISKTISAGGKNVVVLVPSSSKARLSKWIESGAQLADKDNIVKTIKLLNTSNNNLIVFSNRYDGIDLQGDQCRVLIIDGLPQGASLYERYLRKIRPNSKILKSIQGQKIEQGIGRSTRSSRDYSVVLILNPDLITFLSINDNKKFLSPQTRAQLEIGMNFSKKAGVISKENAENALLSIINQSLKRNPQWIKHHNLKLQKAKEETIKTLPIELAEAERKAFDLYNANRSLEASNYLEKCLNDSINELDDNDKGWFMQLVAYKSSQTEGLLKHIKAHEFNSNLCKGIEGIKYKKLDKVIGNQPNKIMEYISQFSEGNAIVLSINHLLEKLSFGMNYDIFERTLVELGQFLGFDAHRPDNEFGKGPDVLWHLTNNEYLIIEAKNEVLASREHIYRSEVEQIGNSLNWFKNEEYVGKIGTPILIHPSYKLADDAFPDRSVKVITEDELNLLKKNIKDFSISLATYYNKTLTIQLIGEQLNHFKLNADSIIKNYTRDLV